MNQQRSRRFKASKEVEEKAAEEERIRAQMIAEGMTLEPKIKSEAFDSNVITPGTPFMGRLSVALQYYVHTRLNSDPGWRDITVVLSDANSPGEGEHKAMAYIRQQKGLPGYDPNTRHVIYGLDADLIMLTLATHEAHVTILREVVFAPDANAKNGGPPDSQAAMDAGLALHGGVAAHKVAIARKPYQFLHAWVLREYLQLELAVPDLPFPADPERVLDDFVFMCFFVGNDFLPHMPTLEIRENAIDLLMTVYKQLLPSLGGYLCEDGRPHLGRVETFISTVGRHEDAIFQRRARMLARQLDRRRRDKAQAASARMRSSSRGSDAAPIYLPAGRDGAILPIQPFLAPRLAAGSQAVQQRPQFQPQALQPTAAHAAPPQGPTQNRSAAEALKAALRAKRVGGGQPAPAAAPAPVAVEDDVDMMLTAAASGAVIPPDDDDDGLGDDDAAGNGGEPSAKKARTGGAADPAAVWASLASTADATKAALEAARDPETVAQQAAAAAAAAKQAKQDAAAAADGAAIARQNKAAADAFLKRLDASLKEKEDLIDTCEADPVKLGEQGWKERYYTAKMKVEPGPQQAAVIRSMVEAYVQGLVWVMRYYYEGCASWTWYYPFHYAPFASDLTNLPPIDVDFPLGAPFKPFTQLMGVLPAASSHALPAAYGPLMTREDSPIIDFYPTDFESDLNGKRFAWQAVTLLPFIDERRLLDAVGSVEHTLTEEEAYRNGCRLDCLFMHACKPLGQSVLLLEQQHAEVPAADRAALELPMDSTASRGMNGRLVLFDGPAQPSKLPSPIVGHPDVAPNQVVGANYKLPPFRHIPPRLPEGAMLPERVVGPEDIPPPPTLWHEEPQRGGGGGGGGGGHGQRHYAMMGGQPQGNGQPVYGAYYAGAQHVQQQQQHGGWYPQQYGGGGGYMQPGQAYYPPGQADAARVLQRSMQASHGQPQMGAPGLSAYAQPYMPPGGYVQPQMMLLQPAFGYQQQQQQQQQQQWQGQPQQGAYMGQQQWPVAEAPYGGPPAAQHVQTAAQMSQANRFAALGALPPSRRDPRGQGR
jgi:5'-3' exoribonuclease 2